MLDSATSPIQNASGKSLTPFKRGLTWASPGLGGKEFACNARAAGDEGSIPGSGRSPGGGHGNPLQFSCLENPHGWRSLEGYRPWGQEESDATEVTEHTGTLCPWITLYRKADGRDGGRAQVGPAPPGPRPPRPPSLSPRARAQTPSHSSHPAHPQHPTREIQGRLCALLNPWTSLPFL